MDPYFENPKLKEHYQYILDYDNKDHKKTHDLVFNHIEGVIASDYDYVLPLEGHNKFLGLIPNPINSDSISFKPLVIADKVVIFLGVNRATYYKKGIPLFEEALKQIKDKYSEKIKIVTVESVPYEEYIQLYDEAHIILDQIYAYDQGYNALEAMAKGKVVFTGAEQEFLDYYGLKEDEVCINALPDVKDLVKKLSWLIENPGNLVEIGKNARVFIEREHQYVKVAQKYLELYQK